MHGSATAVAYGVGRVVVMVMVGGGEGGRGVLA